MKIYNIVRLFIVFWLISIFVSDFYYSYADEETYRMVYSSDKLGNTILSEIRIHDVILVALGIIYLVGVILLSTKMKNNKALSYTIILCDVCIITFIIYSVTSSMAI